jgi:hypothetical protein
MDGTYITVFWGYPKIIWPLRQSRKTRQFWLHKLGIVAASIIQRPVRHAMSLLRHSVLLLGTSAQ